jgi:glycosyltransferase involved in cell wall biosynthesis
VSATISHEVVTPAGEYGGFQLVRFRGHWYGVPPEFVRLDPVRPWRSLRHPAVLWAVSREALEVSIDEFDPTPYRTEPVGEFDGYDLVRHGGRVYGVPRDLGPVDLNLEEDRTRDGVVCGDTPDEVTDRIRAARAANPVEFLGWLPVFKRFGNCGAHPQFGHTEAPPPGYKFVRSDRVVFDDQTPPQTFRQRVAAAVYAVGLSLWVFASTAWRFGVVRSLATLARFVRLFVAMARKTGRVMPALRFAHSRNFQSQVLAPRSADLAFLTSVPYTYGQNPWVIEIEDVTTLFYPFILNGQTAGLDVRRSPYFAAVKALLEAESCRGIVTHMRSTAEMIPTLFGSEVIARKVSYSPLGVRLPERWQQHDDEDGPINLLFTNSWHQNPDGFFLRGGLDVLEAYDVLRRRYPQLRLTLRSTLPRLEERYPRILESGWVRVINRFLPPRQLDELQRESHIYLLPSARIHIVSVLQAMSYGQAVVVSDGWGMDEYIEHGRNGLIVPGRAGKVTWADRDAGLLRENYGPMYAKDKKVIDGLIEAVSLLVEQRAVRRRLGHAARADVATKYTLDRWNAALKAAFDKARAAG